MPYTPRNPLSARVREALGEDDPGLVREIAALERIAMAGVAHVASNGKFPNWPIDRWILVVGFIGLVINNVFVSGGQWATINRDIDGLKSTVTEIGQTQRENRAAITAEMAAIRADLREERRRIVGDDGYPTAPTRTPRQAEPRGTFPRDEQFSGVEQ